MARGLTLGRATPAIGVATPMRLGSVERPMPARLLAAIAVCEKNDPALARRLATLHASAADFLRVVAALPEELPADLRATIDAVTERF